MSLLPDSLAPRLFAVKTLDNMVSSYFDIHIYIQTAYLLFLDPLFGIRLTTAFQKKASWFRTPNSTKHRESMFLDFDQVFLILVIVDTNGECVTGHFYTGGGSTTPSWNINVRYLYILILVREYNIFKIPRKNSSQFFVGKEDLIFLWVIYSLLYKNVLLMVTKSDVRWRCVHFFICTFFYWKTCIIILSEWIFKLQKRSRKLFFKTFL